MKAVSIDNERYFTSAPVAVNFVLQCVSSGIHHHLQNGPIIVLSKATLSEQGLAVRKINIEQ
jgi:hypothetical protein